MSDLLNAIYLDPSLAQYSNPDKTGDEYEQRRFGPLGKINLIVGANNSGKSRMMRLIAGSQQLQVVPRRHTAGGSSFDDYAADIRALAEKLEPYKESQQYRHMMSDSQIIEMRDCRWLGFEEKAKEPLVNQLRSALQVIRAQYTFEFTTGNIEAIIEPFIQRTESDQTFAAMSNPLPEFSRLYIPTLRSLRELGPGDVFEKQTREAYFKDAPKVQIFTGLQLYTQITNMLLGSYDERKRMREFEEFIGKSFFEGQTVTLIPTQGKTNAPRELTIMIGTEKEYPVRELGEGIQAVIMLTFPLFMHGDKPLLAFIEEPELFMHPWLQRVFLEVLSKRFSSHQYFLTTHSNHFLDLTAEVDDVAVFTLEKQLQEDVVSQKEATFRFTHMSGGDRRPLELLGVRNSSVFLSNCTIWIEGITDRRYVGHWLKLYQQHLNGEDKFPEALWFKEDLHYSFVEYSGANLVHWSLLDDEGPDVERLCAKLFLIADSDDAQSGSQKWENHKRLEAKLGNDFALLPVKEIENLTSPIVLLKVLESYKEDLANLKLPKQEDYAEEALGQFIEAKVIVDHNQKKRKGSYVSGNSISDKSGFCDKAIKATETWADVSVPAKKLAKRVFEFVQRNNPRTSTPQISQAV